MQVSIEPTDDVLPASASSHLACNLASRLVVVSGYGNVAPKTVGGRVFCILFGLCGIPLCLTWISELGTFFGSRAKRLSQVLLHKGLRVVRRPHQASCTQSRGGGGGGVQSASSSCTLRDTSCLTSGTQSRLYLWEI